MEFPAVLLQLAVDDGRDCLLVSSRQTASDEVRDCDFTAVGELLVQLPKRLRKRLLQLGMKRLIENLTKTVK